MIVSYGKQGDCGVSLTYECRDPVPHSFIPSLKSKDISVPFRCFLDVGHGESYVINSFELHEKLRQNLQNYWYGQQRSCSRHPIASGSSYSTVCLRPTLRLAIRRERPSLGTEEVRQRVRRRSSACSSSRSPSLCILYSKVQGGARLLRRKQWRRGQTFLWC